MLLQLEIMNKIKYILISLLACASVAKADQVLTYEERIVALTILGEARGEGKVGMYAVGCVIKKRTLTKNLSPAKVCLQPWQFTVWNAGQGKVKKESELYYLWKSPSMQYARKLARDVCKQDWSLRDITRGADHYCTLKTEPYWAFKIVVENGEETKRPIEPVVIIGNHKFYNLKPIGLHGGNLGAVIDHEIMLYLENRNECQITKKQRQFKLTKENWKDNKKGVIK